MTTTPLPVSARDLVVDIVISSYNYAPYLEDAIASARAQTHEAVNVIVVDDGSTDGSREILSRHEGELTVVLKDNGGQASAMNEGLLHSGGDVVIFLDADDVLHPEAAAEAAAAFAADPEVVKVQSRMDVIGGDGRPTGVLKPPPHLPLPSGDMRAAELASPFDLTWMATSANSFRAAALRRILPMPEGPFRLCADWYLVHLTALLGPVVSLEDVNVSYRVHGENGYEPEEAGFDLDHIRRTVGYAAATIAELERLADELGLAGPRPVLSVWDLANRLISLRMDRAAHPIATDTRRGLVADAVRAARRRTDASGPKQFLFVAWFAVTALAPRAAVPWLGEVFLYSDRRAPLNRILGKLRR
jgi:hypothetical protein